MQEPYDVNPPTAEQVLARVVCLMHQLFRLNFEMSWAESSAPADRQAIKAEYNDWRETLEEDIFLPAASADEKRRLAADLGTWSEDDGISASFGMQAIPFLLWAIELLPELPEMGVAVDDIPPLEMLDDPEELVGDVSLRSRDELDAVLAEAQTVYEEMEDPDTDEEAAACAAIVARTMTLEWLAGLFTNWDEAWEDEAADEVEM